MDSLRIARGEGDLLFDEQGRPYIDLFTAHGTAWLGHSCPQIVQAVREQLERVWCTGAVETGVLLQARQSIEEFFPKSHRLCAQYSTGMEAVEFAIRLARGATGRKGLIGFDRMMHGKSQAAAALGWPNAAGVESPDIIRLPFVDRATENEILNRLEDALKARQTAAVFIEPLQGCSGHHASPEFYRQAAALCGTHGVLLVFDEILTGFYRTGPVFFFSDLGLLPDAVLIGKALGNGFPVSGVVARREIEMQPSMLSGSTYAGNPLAAAIIVAVLRRMRELDIPSLVSRIAPTVQMALESLPSGVTLRGRGALWVLELPETVMADRLIERIRERGVAIGSAERILRILPSATIDPDRLTRACKIVAEEVASACSTAEG